MDNTKLAEISQRGLLVHASRGERRARLAVTVQFRGKELVHVDLSMAWAGLSLGGLVWLLAEVLPQIWLGCRSVDSRIP